jgi:hypothetical protein
MRIKSLAAVVALSLSSASFAQTAAEPEFTAERFRSHVAFLADDLLEGRDTGSRGHEMAAHYVATQLQGLGLRPAGPNGSYYQQVPFVRYQMTDAPASLSVGGQSFAHGQQIIFGQSPFEGRLQAEAPVVFVGYGLHAPQYGLDDYRGLDVRGRIVVVLSGLPEGLPSDVAAHLSQDKRRQASERGAVGMITLRTPAEAERMPFARMAGFANRPGITWVGPNGQPHTSGSNVRFNATVDTPVAEALFQGARRSYSQVMAEMAAGRRPRGFALRPRVAVDRTSANTRVTSPNVVAMLPGSDPALANEYVLLMGHLDHVGVGQGEGDQIHNGALDNATGIATLLEVARQMTQGGQRPRRPILFAAVTAEEKGLLGAEYLASNPVVGTGRVVGVVNLDMPVLLYNFSDVIAFGAEHSTLGPIVQRAGARMNVALTPDPLPQEGLFTRSDHYRFVQRGIPSVFLMTGFAGEGQQRFTEFLRTNYHSPRDDINQPINWEAGARFARLNYLIASEIANAPEAPRWYRDSFFGTTFAPNSERAERPAAAAATPAATQPAAN